MMYPSAGLRTQEPLLRYSMSRPVARAPYAEASHTRWVVMYMWSREVVRFDGSSGLRSIVRCVSGTEGYSSSGRGETDA